MMEPFVIFSPANSNDVFCCNALLADDGSGTLTFEGGLTIRPWLDECYKAMPVNEQTTSFENYSLSIDSVVRTFGPLGGKAVICRQITGKFKNFDFKVLTRRYFSMFPDMFCFAFYHPRYNFWMGASPELLVESTGPHTARTRALAGTRRNGLDEPWDEKNLNEHRVVSDDICRRIEALGTQWKAVPRRPVEFPYGEIAHLCTPIDIECVAEPIDISMVANAIHPTPAVGGYPRQKAIETIAKLESSPRAYYGGIISTPSTAYVMLRCVHFDSHNWCVYTGSGVTGASTSLDEWNETEAKAAPLVNLLNAF